jgi:hypothetical protein
LRFVYLPPAVGFGPELDEELEEVRKLGNVVVFEPQSSDFEGMLVELEPIADLKSVLVGFNLGGGVASLYASRLSALGLVAAGSIARLSRFYQFSDHPVAVARRKSGFGSPPEYDLATTLPQVTCPKLVQFGRQDEWLYCSEEISEARWVDDGHEMMGAEARQQRLDFFRGLAGAS